MLRNLIQVKPQKIDNLRRNLIQFTVLCSVSSKVNVCIINASVYVRKNF